MWIEHPPCPETAGGESNETVLPAVYHAIYQHLRRGRAKALILLAEKVEVLVGRVQRRQMLAYALASCPYCGVPT
jgi:hypothetical protein